jgi:hypothetical protein
MTPLVVCVTQLSRISDYLIDDFSPRDRRRWNLLRAAAIHARIVNACQMRFVRPH